MPVILPGTNPNPDPKTVLRAARILANRQAILMTDPDRLSAGLGNHLFDPTIGREEHSHHFVFEWIELF
jgi:hypothetical protein